MSRKPRADSPLKTLSEERQAAIGDYCRTHTLEETVAWLRADGVRTSRSALSEWLSWWSLQQRFRQSAQTAEEFRRWLTEQFPQLSEADLDARAALHFQFEAMRTGDPETYLAFATARHKAQMDKLKFDQRERALKLDREKFEFDAADAALKHLPALRQIAADHSLSASEKILAVRRRLFGVLPEQK